MAKVNKNTWEKFWEKDVEDIYPTSGNLANNLLENFDVSGKKVLEIGAGTGRDSVRLKKKGGVIFVLDYARNSLKIVKQVAEKEGLKIHYILGDAFNLPIKSGSFDVTFHQGLIEHFKEPEGIIDENIRIVKEDGIVLCDVPQKYHIYTVIKHILISMDKWFAGWETEFSPKQLKKLFERENVEVVKLYGEWMYPSLYYRILRELFMKTGIKLPMFPKIPGLFSIRKVLREKMNNKKIFLNTYLNLGIIVRKIR